MNKSYTCIMFGIYILLFLKISLIKCFYIPSIDVSNDTAEEVQNAICAISTKDVDASANATLTRQLKGVCTSNELNLKLDKLQTKILQEIDGIKYILETNGFNMPDESTRSTDAIKQAEYIYMLKNSTNSTLSLRTEEILMYNNSVIDDVQGSKFVYYWKIENVRLLLQKRDMYKSSPHFQILGHNLRLQLYPNHLKNHYFGIELRPDSPGFIKKHKITILNQFNAGYDIESDTLYGIKGDRRIFRVFEKIIDYEGFIINDYLIVKLEIFLNT